METMTKLPLSSSHSRTSGHSLKSFSEVMRYMRIG